jgi:hypothetical protein
MADLRTYADLKTAILRTLERENDARAQVKVALWVAQAEEDINSRLRAPWMMQVAQTTLDEEWEELPSGFVGIRSVMAKWGSNWIELHAVSPSQLEGYLGQPGFPSRYCIENYSITVVPNQRPVDLRYTFWLNEEPLGSADQTNTTLQRASGVYLYGACRHAAVFYGDDAGLQRWNAAFEQALAQANNLAAEWAMGDGIVMAMKPRRRTIRIGVVE